MYQETLMIYSYMSHVLKFIFQSCECESLISGRTLVNHGNLSKSSTLVEVQAASQCQSVVSISVLPL